MLVGVGIAESETEGDSLHADPALLTAPIRTRWKQKNFYIAL